MHAALSNTHPSLLSPPLLSLRDMCAHCASRQFQLSTTKAQTACCSFPLVFCPNYSPSLVSSLHCFHSLPLCSPLPSLSSVILPCSFPQADIKVGPAGRRGLWPPKSYCFSRKGTTTEDLETTRGYIYILEEGEEKDYI